MKKLSLMDKEWQKLQAILESPTMTALEQEARRAGYYRSPNDRDRWYAGSPGLPCYDWPVEVFISDKVEVIRTYQNGRPVFEVIASFDTFADYLATCPTVQAVPSGANVWD